MSNVPNLHSSSKYCFKEMTKHKGNTKFKENTQYKTAGVGHIELSL